MHQLIVFTRICDFIYILTFVRFCQMTNLLPLLSHPGRWTGHLVAGLQFWRSSLHTLYAGHRFSAVSRHRPHAGHTARLQPHATRHRTRVPHAHLPSEEITPTHKPFHINVMYRIFSENRERWTFFPVGIVWIMKSRYFTPQWRQNGM